MKFSFALLLLLLIATGQVSIAQFTGTFTPTGQLTTSRESHTATLLTNGKVLELLAAEAIPVTSPLRSCMIPGSRKVV